VHGTEKSISQLGEFYLGSDAITHSYKDNRGLSTIVA